MTHRDASCPNKNYAITMGWVRKARAICVYAQQNLEIGHIYLFSVAANCTVLKNMLPTFQVRLYQYSTESAIWKSGSVLQKNDHHAVVKQTK